MACAWLVLLVMLPSRCVPFHCRQALSWTSCSRPSLCNDRCRFWSGQCAALPVETLQVAVLVQYCGHCDRCCGPDSVSSPGLCPPPQQRPQGEDEGGGAREQRGGGVRAARRPTGQITPPPAPIAEVAAPQGPTVARCPVDCGPTLTLPVLAGRASRWDSSALPFLLSQLLLAEQEAKRRRSWRQIWPPGSRSCWRRSRGSARR